MRVNNSIVRIVRHVLFLVDGFHKYAAFKNTAKMNSRFKPFLLIRADAGPGIGAGHIMRCLALAEAWMVKGGGVAFLSKAPEAIIAKIKLAGAEFIPLMADAAGDGDLNETLAAARRLNADWLAVDGYKFTSGYLDKLRGKAKIMLFDDLGEHDRYPVDLIVNSAADCSAEAYRGLTGGRLLLGARHKLFRREFRGSHERESGGDVRRALVSMGGADMKNAAGLALNALALVAADFETNMVMGSICPHLELIRRRAESSPHPVKILSDVKDMAAVMAAADMAVCAGGGTACELALVGVPSLVISVAGNQYANAAALDALGVAVNLGAIEGLDAGVVAAEFAGLAADSAARQTMSRRGRSLYDGLGAERIVETMIDYASGADSIREAEFADTFAIWRLANQKSVRSNSFSPDPIPLSGHIEWFDGRLSSDACAVFVHEGIHGIDGQIRYDRSADGVSAEMDIAVDESERGKGVAAKMVMGTVDAAMAKLGVLAARATVLERNQASMGVFLKSGFEELGSDLERGFRVRRFERRASRG